MNIRIISGAFIIEGNNYLMMERSDNKKIAQETGGIANSLATIGSK